MRSHRWPGPGPGRARPRPTPRTVALVAAPMAVGAAAWALLLVSGAAASGWDASTRLPGGSTVAAALALLLVVAVPLVLTTVLGWRGSTRTGDAAVLAGAAVIGACLLQVSSMRAFHWLQVVGFLCGLLLVSVGMLLPRSPDRAPHRRP